MSPAWIAIVQLKLGCGCTLRVTPAGRLPLYHSAQLPRSFPCPNHGADQKIFELLWEER